MNAPLSGKQHREYLKMQAQEAREGTKMEREESRKEQLHEIKLQEAASGANQKLGHKEQTHQAKLQEQKAPLGNRAQAAPRREGQAGPTDTVPAMLTPGEAVIPRSAAQDPKNKNAIRRMVAEGRDGYADGVTGVPDFAQGRPDEPGFVDGTMSVPRFSRGSSAQTGYADGTVEVPNDYPEQAQASYGVPAPDPRLLTNTTVANDRVPQLQVQVPKQDDTFQQWKNATMGVESSYGNDPKTWEKNNQGAMGLYGMTDTTFKGMKKTGMIPEDWSITDRQQNTQASEILADDAWKRAGGDPAKASAIWYAGPKAIDKETGTIIPYKDLKNPNAPNTQQYADKVGSIMGKAASSVIPPTGREILIAKQDLSTSTNPAVRAKAQAILNSANVVPDTRASIYRAVSPELDSSGRPMKFPDTAGGGRGVVNPPPATVVPEAEAILKPYEPQTYDQDWFKTLGLNAEKEVPKVEAVKQEAEAIVDPVEKKNFLERAISSIFGGKDSLFQDQDLARFAIVAAGGMLTGGSTGGSLKYAGLDVLKHADARSIEVAKQQKLIEAQKVATAAEAGKNTRELFESRTGTYMAALKEPNVSPEVKKKAIEMAQAPAKSREESIRNLEQATSYLNVNSTNKAAEPKHSMGWFNDTMQPMMEDAQGNRYIKNDKGEYVKPTGQVLTESEYSAFSQKSKNEFTSRVKPELMDQLDSKGKPISAAAASDKADQMHTWFSNMSKTLGNKLDAKALGEIQASTITQLKESGKLNSKLDEAGYKAALLGNAAIKLRPTDKELFNASKDGKSVVVPDGEVLAKYGDTLKRYAEKNNVPFTDASSDAVTAWKTFKATKPKEADAIEYAARASKQNVSPMMFWIMTNLK